MLHRRTMLTAGAATFAVGALGRIGARAEGDIAPTPGASRSFEIRTRIALLRSKGAVRAWVPTPSGDRWGQTCETRFTGNADEAYLDEGPVGMVAARWKAGAEAPTLEVVSRVSIRARAIAVCSGSVRMPSRQVYGIRVAPATFGDDSLGPNIGTATASHHRRAEVWLDGAGWFPVDPAGAGKAPFGSCETIWIAYNDAHDVKLPGAEADPLRFFIDPQVETVVGLMDRLNPNGFRSVISTREVKDPNA